MKYKLTNEKNNEGLFRIIALKDFGNVKKGELGGFVAKLENLSQDGNCWVWGNARVSGKAKVSDNAKVFGDAWVFGNARVFGYAEVFGKARVSDNAEVYENARVSGDAWVYDNAWVYGDAWVYNDAEVYNDAKVSDNARVYARHHCINISNLQYNFTMTHNHVQIGCEMKTHNGWINTSLENANKLGLHEENYELFKSLITSLLPHVTKET